MTDKRVELRQDLVLVELGRSPVRRVMCRDARLGFRDQIHSQDNQLQDRSGAGNAAPGSKYSKPADKPAIRLANRKTPCTRRFHASSSPQMPSTDSNRVCVFFSSASHCCLGQPGYAVPEVINAAQRDHGKLAGILARSIASPAGPGRRRKRTRPCACTSPAAERSGWDDRRARTALRRADCCRCAARCRHCRGSRTKCPMTW